MLQSVFTSTSRRHGGIVTRALSSSGASGKVYTEKQQRLGRPLSPHVTIYDFPVTAISSIMNRVTGCALMASVGSISLLGLVGADVASTVHCAQTFPLVAPLSKFAVAFPLSYHYLGGLRHIIWDNKPDLLETSRVEPSSATIIGVAAVLGLGASMVTLSSPKNEKSQ